MSVNPRSLRGWLDRPRVIHPFLVVLPPLLALIKLNLAMTGPWSGLYLYGVFCVMAAVLMLALQAMLGNPGKAGAVTSIIILGVLTNTAVGALWWLLAIVLLALCVLIAVVPRQLHVLTTFLNIAASFAVAILVYQIARIEYQGGKPTYRRDFDAATVRIRTATKAFPDIYYIVLDGYGRSDVLKRLFHFENELPSALEERGFFVADHAHSNYSQTALSFAATLNMSWIDALLDDGDEDSTWRRPLAHLIGQNRVVEMLRDTGYRIIDYPGDYSVTHLENPDESRRPWLYFTELEYTFLSDTILDDITRLIGAPERGLTQVVRRNHVRWVLSDLRHGRRAKTPAFIYVHLLIPHPPFLFRPDGSYRRSNLSFSFSDGSHWRHLAEGSGESYVAGYRDSVEYVDHMLIQALDAILRSSARPQIILIQGDHGPGSKLDWNRMEKSDVQERMAILSAYYFPDHDYSRLRPTITPINSFRVVFDQFFDAELPQLEDRIYFNTWLHPYDPVDVTDLLTPDNLKQSFGS